MDIRKYMASCYTIDFVNYKILLMYNYKLNKWMQPSGYINDSELELPGNTAIRTAKEATGLDIELLNNKQPISIENYNIPIDKNTDFSENVIDFQYVGRPIYMDNNIILKQGAKGIWQEIFTIDFNKEIDPALTEKIKKLYIKYNI